MRNYSLMSVIGPELTSRYARNLVAVEGKADVTRTLTVPDPSGGHKARKKARSS
jgi:hypothetical protein